MGEWVEGKFVKLPPTFDYEDSEIFGSRAKIDQLIRRSKASNDSECVIFAIDHYADKRPWRLKDLERGDKRLVAMNQGLEIKYALPIQRYSWPIIDRSSFASLIISPEATGKTHAHILYAVSRCIQLTPLQATNELLDGANRHQFEPNMTTNLDQLIIHPKFIIICSSQDHAEAIKRTIWQMKEKAYGIDATDFRRHMMPPVSGSVNIKYDDEKLALRCRESDILIGTPPTILKCLTQRLIDFGKCQKVFFDDLDVSLQLQNKSVRELIKIYLRQCHLGDPSTETSASACRIHLFSRKWTDLVGQVMSNVFPQRILLFGSLAEASVYNNVKFEVETYQDNKEKCSILSSMIVRLLDRASNTEKICIVSRTVEEAQAIGQALTEMGHNVRVLRKDSSYSNSRDQVGSSLTRDLVSVISDTELEIMVEVSNRRSPPLDDIMHIVHASLPEDMLKFDQRFRLSFRHIQDEKSGLTSTVFIGPDFNTRLAKQLHDLMSRSKATQLATKLTMRDFSKNQASRLCWRWATTGLCRLEKLSPYDGFGSYCSDRHSFERVQTVDNRWPASGFVKLTTTRICSPSEFYFRFESYHNPDKGKWVKFEKSGCEHMWKLQQDLNQFKSAELRSVPLKRIRKGHIYGVFFPQESRIDRVRLLDEPNHANGTIINADLEYSKRFPSFKIDYGDLVEVYVKNLIELPERLSKYPAQSHRGFHLGYKPTDNEPNWLPKAQKCFRELVEVTGACDIEAWLRQNRDGCFWFENLVVTRKLTNIDSTQPSTTEPHRQLVQENLAELTISEPTGMVPSLRLETMCKWNNKKLNEVAQYAFLRREIETIEIYLLSIEPDFTILAMQTCFKKQLDDLELRIAHDFETGELSMLNYFAVDVYCIARISLGGNQTFNRAKIIKIIQYQDDIESHESPSDTKVRVLCLDYGDLHTLAKTDLYQAKLDHIRLLPFQACRCKLANINNQLRADQKLNDKVLDSIYEFTRDQHDKYLPIKAQRDDEGNLYLFVQSINPSVYAPLSSLLQQDGLKLHAEANKEMEKNIEVMARDEELVTSQSDGLYQVVNQYISDILRQIVVRELKSYDDSQTAGK